MIFTRVGEDGRLLPALLQRGASSFLHSLNSLAFHRFLSHLVRSDNPPIGVIDWPLDAYIGLSLAF